MWNADVLSETEERCHVACVCGFMLAAEMFFFFGEVSMEEINDGHGFAKEVGCSRLHGIRGCDLLLSASSTTQGLRKRAAPSQGGEFRSKRTAMLVQKQLSLYTARVIVRLGWSPGSDAFALSDDCENKYMPQVMYCYFGVLERTPG